VELLLIVGAFDAWAVEVSPSAGGVVSLASEIPINVVLVPEGTLFEGWFAGVAPLLAGAGIPISVACRLGRADPGGVLAALGATDWTLAAGFRSGGFDASSPEGAGGSFESWSSLMAVLADCSSGNGRPVYLPRAIPRWRQVPHRTKIMGFASDWAKTRTYFASTADRPWPDICCGSATAESQKR
jgi:hypothetical protein